MAKKFGPYDGMSAPSNVIPRKKEPTVEPIVTPATKGVAMHVGAGWYELDPPFDGDARVRGLKNVPETYDVIENDDEDSIVEDDSTDEEG